MWSLGLKELSSAIMRWPGKAMATSSQDLTGYYDSHIWVIVSIVQGTNVEVNGGIEWENSPFGSPLILTNKVRTHSLTQPEDYTTQGAFSSETLRVGCCTWAVLYLSAWARMGWSRRVVIPPRNANCLSTGYKWDSYCSSSRSTWSTSKCQIFLLGTR